MAKAALVTKANDGGPIGSGRRSAIAGAEWTPAIPNTAWFCEGDDSLATSRIRP